MLDEKTMSETDPDYEPIVNIKEEKWENSITHQHHHPMEIKVENPWHIQSIYELQYFICPSCPFRHSSKQDFINHTYESHPEVIVDLENIKDGSLR